MPYINENKLYADIVELVNNGLTYVGISDFTVLRATQVTNLSEITPTVMIDRVSSNQYGWQGGKDYTEDSTFKRKDVFLQEVKFTIRALKRRSGVQQTAEVTTSEDAIRGIMTYFQSMTGIHDAIDKGYQILRLKENPEPYFISDSDQYEKSPSFDLILIIKQTYAKTIDRISSVEGNTIALKG